MNVVGSDCYRSFIEAASTPVSFRLIHGAFWHQHRPFMAMFLLAGSDSLAGHGYIDASG